MTLPDAISSRVTARSRSGKSGLIELWRNIVTRPARRRSLTSSAVTASWHEVNPARASAARRSNDAPAACPSTGFPSSLAARILPVRSASPCSTSTQPVTSPTAAADGSRQSVRTVGREKRSPVSAKDCGWRRINQRNFIGSPASCSSRPARRSGRASSISGRVSVTAIVVPPGSTAPANSTGLARMTWPCGSM